MTVLSQVLNMKIKQADYTIAVYQAALNDDEEVYIELPHWFDIKLYKEYVSLLNHVLYGMVNSTKWWFEMLSMGLQ